MTSYQRQCDVMTSHRRLDNIILAPNAAEVGGGGGGVCVGGILVPLRLMIKSGFFPPKI